jgi:glutamate dehydrogenase (NADP+)
MTAKQYIDRVLDNVREKHADKPEFIQAVGEFFPTLAPYLEEHPEIEEHNVLELIVEPERIIQFRIPWEDDDGRWQVNLGYRVQYNSALGPYKGGIRFNPTVNESILRFLGFEQTFKNGLTNQPLGGGKGGSDFDPRDKSDKEIMRFTHSFMTELQKYIGPDLDVPAGDMGVGHREIGYMYGQYKRLNQASPGVLTGKPTGQWGSFGRTEATGYGVVYFAENALWDLDERLIEKDVVVSGTGNVSTYTVEKATQLGARVIAVSDSQGYIYDEDGIDAETLKALKPKGSGALKHYREIKPNAEYVEGASVWSGDFEYDIAFPCATQNEIDQEMAENMAKNCGIKAIFEGANMPSSDEAVKIFKEHDILYGLGKAANAGGVAVSALEMAQNSQREQWDFEEVDERLKVIMEDIYKLCSETAEKYVGDRHNLQAGANIAGFARVANAMIRQGLV